MFGNLSPWFGRGISFFFIKNNGKKSIAKKKRKERPNEGRNPPTTPITETHN
jgi:hypothetical protein